MIPTVTTVEKEQQQKIKRELTPVVANGLVRAYFLLPLSKIRNNQPKQTQRL